MIIKNSISTNDFNQELYKLLSEDTDNSDTDNNNNICLISNLSLEDNYVKLKCNHTFNYESIFNEVKNQKKYNQLEVCHLKNNQIKCPYCRTVQDGLLPSIIGFPKIRYVNHPSNMQYLPCSCVYKFLSGKRKGEFCGKGCLITFCTQHEKIIAKREIKKQEKEKKKSQKQQQKLQQKLLKSNVHLEKQKNKLTKKIINKKIKITNEIKKDTTMLHVNNESMLMKIDDMLEQLNIKIPKSMDNHPETELPTNTCRYIFKRGKNKGMRCMCKKPSKKDSELENMVIDGFLCEKHYQQIIKSTLKKTNKKVKLESIIINQIIK